MVRKFSDGGQRGNSNISWDFQIRICLLCISEGLLEARDLWEGYSEAIPKLRH